MRARLVDLAVLALGVALVGVAASAVRAPESPVGGDAAAYVPADGARTVLRSGQDRGVFESARLPLGPSLFSAPGVMSTALFVAQEDRTDRAGYVWRQVQSDYGGTSQRASFYAVTARGVEMLGQQTEGTPLVYDPPWTAMPAKVRAGVTWRDRGDAVTGGLATYDIRGTITRVTRTCAYVTYQVRYEAKGEVLADEEAKEKWCDGRGSVSLTAQPTEPPSLPGLADAAPAFDLSGGERWRATPLSTISRMDAEGSDAPYGFGQFSGDPAITSDGTVAIADSALSDVLLLRRDGDDLVLRARAHPGATPASVTAVGDVVVVGTADRRLCGYTSRGAWLWCREVPDVVDARGVQVGTDRVALLALDGRLRLYDARSGERVWTAPGVVATHHPVQVAGDRIVTLVDDGTVTSWRARNGRPAWQVATDRSAASFAAGAERVVVSGASTVVLDADDGTERGFESAPEILPTTLLAGDGAVQVGSIGSQRVGASGRQVAWRGARALVAVGDGTRVLAVSADGSRVRLLDAEGRTMRDWDLPRAAARPRWLLPLDDGVLLLTSGLKAVVLS